jgi:hypothetical protein
MHTWDKVEIFLIIFSTQNSIDMSVFTTNKRTCDVEISGYLNMLFYAIVEL